ncbi:MAG TPA: hypothetical protein VIL38_06120 [Thermaerobacter sp.]
MSLGLLRVHLRLARSGLGIAAGVAAAFLPVLIWPERLAGHPLHWHTVLRLVEEFLVLAVLPATVPLWSDVEGRRPGLWRALPFSRATVVLWRCGVPLAVYVLVALGMVAVALFRLTGPGGTPWGAGLRVVALALPAAAWLGALAALVAVLVRVPVAGAGAAMAWWALEAVTQGDLTGPLYLFAGSGGLRAAGVDPGAVMEALALGRPLPPALVANRWALLALAGLATLVTAQLYRRNERFLRPG